MFELDLPLLHRSHNLLNWKEKMACVKSNYVTIIARGAFKTLVKRQYYTIISLFPINFSGHLIFLRFKNRIIMQILYFYFYFFVHLTFKLGLVTKKSLAIGKDFSSSCYLLEGFAIYNFFKKNFYSSCNFSKVPWQTIVSSVQ